MPGVTHSTCYRPRLGLGVARKLDDSIFTLEEHCKEVEDDNNGQHL